jgi:hypothetical protein
MQPAAQGKKTCRRKETLVKRMPLGTLVAVLAIGGAGRAAEPAPKPTITTITLADSDDAIGLLLTPGGARGGQLLLDCAGGGKQLLRLEVGPQSLRRRVRPPAGAAPQAKPIEEDVTAADSFLGISGAMNLRVFARPDLRRYTDPQQDELLATWNDLPPASETPVHFEFRNRPDRVELWINGCYAGRFAGVRGLRKVEATLPTGAEIWEAASYRLPPVDDRYCPLDVRRIAKPGAMRDARVSIAAGPQRVAGVPLIVADGPGNGDIGVVRQMKGSWALECDEHLSRTPFDGMPETLHFTVPQAFYHKAYVLCAAEPDAGKEPVLTVRMTRFGKSGRGEALAHAAVTLPREGLAVAANLTRVGAVRYPSGDREVEAPLYLAEIPLDAGRILDLLTAPEDPHAAMAKGGYLDIDLLGRIEGIKPVPKATSAVHVFGITLERSPVEFALTQKQPGNIFRDDEIPEAVAVVKATEPCRVVLSWKITDVAGTVVREEAIPLDFAAAGEVQERTVGFAAPRPGWYGLEFTMRRPDEAAGRPGAAKDAPAPLLVHQAAFAHLGKDRRKAGYESPYGVWWFGHAHYGCDDAAVIGPMLHKGGFRKTTFGWTKYTEADFAPWQVTHNQIGWLFKTDDPAGVEKKVAEWRRKFPHCRSILIFHESYGNYLPAELFGGKQEEDEQTVEKARKRVALATQAARLYREKFPELEIIVGNTSASTAIIASLLRHGFDTSLVGFIGIETAAGQTGMPEKLWEGGPQGAYLSREVARRFGRDLPVTGCYEYTCRCDRNLGVQRQAEFYVRDVLLAHAYGYRHISPGGLYDPGNAYAHTLYGNGGLCQRYPLLYPKPAYVAMATVTAALDQVTFRRNVPTGSATVYVHEYDRADGRRAYALWTPRAGAELELEFPPDAGCELIDFYGAVSAPMPNSGRLTLTVGPAPQYLLSTRPLEAASVVRQITEATPAGFHVADALDGVRAWSLSADASLSQKTGELPRFVPGTFDLRPVHDAERGACLELELHGDDALSELIGESCAIAAAEPAPVPGEPHTLGMWVKGNSSWGKVMFEFEDAKGGVWRTHANAWHDWQGELSINFDGWHLIRFPIDTQSPVIYSSPGGRCQRVKGGDGGIAYPIRLTKLHFVMNRKALDPTEMQPVSPVIRISGVGGY